MLVYTLTIRYIYPHLNLVYGVLLNADITTWEKILEISPFIAGFLLGVAAAIYFYERQIKNEKKQTEEINTKIKEISEQHVEEFKTLSEEQLKRYNKEITDYKEDIKTKDLANQNLVDLWHQAIKGGNEEKDRLLKELNEEKSKSLESLRNYYDAILAKKDEIIADDKNYIRQKEKEMKDILTELHHSVEAMNNYITREHTGSMLEIHKQLAKLLQYIEKTNKELKTE